MGVAIQYRRTNLFSDYGCTFTGDLVVFDYEEYLHRLPNWGKFGAMATFDALDEAKRSAKLLFGDIEILLAIPILVIRVGDI